jgi:hypothetical protein
VIRLRWWQRGALQSAGVAAVIVGLAAWGTHLERAAPRWFTDTPLTKTQTASLLTSSIHDLRSVTLEMHGQGAAELSADAVVTFRHPYVDGHMEISGLTATAASVQLCRSTAYVPGFGGTELAVNLSSRSQGYQQTVLSQVSAAMDLPTVFAAASKGVLSTRYVATETIAGAAADRFDLVVAAGAVRELLPPRLTQNSANIRRTVPLVVWIRPGGRLVQFATLINGTDSLFTVRPGRPQTCPAQFQTKVATAPAGKV